MKRSQYIEASNQIAALRDSLKPIERKWVINAHVEMSVSSPFDGGVTRPYVHLSIVGNGAGIREVDRDKINELLRDIDDWCDDQLSELPPSGMR